MAASDARAFTWTLGLKDQISKPAKAIGTTYTKVTAGVTKGTDKLKTATKKTSDSLKRQAKRLQSTGKQLRSFGNIVKSITIGLGIGAIAGGLLWAFNKVIGVLFAFESAMDSLIAQAPASGAALASMGADVMHFAGYMGESYDETVKWMGALMEIRPYDETFRDFAKSVLIYADATGQSREQVAGLYQEMKNLGGESFDIRRLGNAMAYWADTTEMTHAEIMGLAGSMKGLIMLTPRGARTAGMMSDLLGIGAAMKKAGGDAADVGKLMLDVQNITNASMRGFVGARGGMGGAEISAAAKGGRHADIFRAMVKAAKSFVEEHGDILTMLPNQVQAMTGMDAATVASLANVQLEDISKKSLEAAKRADAADRKHANKQRSIMRQWDRMKMTFISMITKIASPLTSLLKDQLDPIRKVMESLRDATGAAIDAFTSDKNVDKGFFEKIKDAALAFWQELTKSKDVEKFVVAFQKALTRGRTWFSKEFFSPLIAETWNELMPKFLHVDLEGSRQAEAIRYREDMADVTKNYRAREWKWQQGLQQGQRLTEEETLRLTKLAYVVGEKQLIATREVLDIWRKEYQLHKEEGENLGYENDILRFMQEQLNAEIGQ